MHAASAACMSESVHNNGVMHEGDAVERLLTHDSSRDPSLHVHLSRILPWTAGSHSSFDLSFLRMDV